MGSTVCNLGVAHVGDTLNVRARITKNYEHKGHKWVELDAMVVANETTPIVRATHIAIYHPRQLRKQHSLSYLRWVNRRAFKRVPISQPQR